ncbi:hypothetical protein OIU85_017816, partial [Salix viminalis]
PLDEVQVSGGVSRGDGKVVEMTGLSPERSKLAPATFEDPGPEKPKPSIANFKRDDFDPKAETDLTS